MKQGLKPLSVPLSQLVPSKRNPRKVRPSQQSHQSLVALIRAYGLLQPLVVRPVEGKARQYEVVAGHRRLRALREIHRNDGDPRIACVLRDVDDETADAVSLGENFGREAMHPLDEAEAFDKLAGEDGKDAGAIAAGFGVEVRYVRQRMKLAGLSKEVKEAYRAGAISTAVAEAFSSVPQEKQLQVWQETGGQPRHAEHVRNLIANDWIEAKIALFDIARLPMSAISGDLFSDRVLVERQAFMPLQIEAMEIERRKLLDDGWKQSVAGRYEDVHDQSRSLDVPEREFDEATTKRLVQIAEKKAKLEAKLETLDEQDEKGQQSIERKYEELDAEERQIEQDSPIVFSEATKAIGTAFLMLLPDGRVQREYRVPKPPKRSNANGQTSSSESSDISTSPAIPTSDDLSDKQLAVTFTHQALVVREALLQNTLARKRVLAMILHDQVRSEALAVRHEANATTIHAGQGEGFTSQAFDRLKQRRVKLDPIADQFHMEERSAYDQLSKLKPAKLDDLIDLLTVSCLTAHLQRRTELVHRLATELKVNVREDWRPDAAWLSGFQKIQLSHLLTELLGPIHTPAPERKKSELVEQLANLFTDAAEGKLEDKSLAQRVNAWLPSSLRVCKDEPKAS